MFNWEQQMHAKYSTMYNYYYNTPTITNFGPSFSSQWQCDEWAQYVKMREEGSITCPCCGKQKMKPRTRRTDLLFRVKCIMKKCRERGKWDLLARLCYKYEMTTIGESYYDQNNT